MFLEPEGRNTPELYVQGFSTGLPERLQLALLHTLPGEQRPGSHPGNETKAKFSTRDAMWTVLSIYLSSAELVGISVRTT